MQAQATAREQRTGVNLRERRVGPVGQKCLHHIKRGGEKVSDELTARGEADVGPTRPVRIFHAQEADFLRHAQPVISQNAEDISTLPGSTGHRHRLMFAKSEPHKVA